MGGLSWERKGNLLESKGQPRGWKEHLLQCNGNLGRGQGIARGRTGNIAEFFFFQITESENHRMTQVGRGIKDHEAPTPLPGRATKLPCLLDQVTQGPIQSGLGHLQGWGIHNVPGQPVPRPHHSPSKEIPIFYLTALLQNCQRSCSPTTRLLPVSERAAHQPGAIAIQKPAPSLHSHHHPLQHLEQTQTARPLYRNHSYTAREVLRCLKMRASEEELKSLQNRLPWHQLWKLNTPS